MHSHKTKLFKKWLRYTHCTLYFILGLQSISRDAEDNGSHPRRLDPTMELIAYSFVLYLLHGRRDVKCKPSIYKVHKIFYDIFPNGVCTGMKYVQYFSEWCIPATIATLNLRFYPDYTTMQRNSRWRSCW